MQHTAQLNSTHPLKDLYIYIKARDISTAMTIYLLVGPYFSAHPHDDNVTGPQFTKKGAEMSVLVWPGLVHSVSWPNGQ